MTKMNKRIKISCNIKNNRIKNYLHIVNIEFFNPKTKKVHFMKKSKNNQKMLFDKKKDKKKQNKFSKNIDIKEYLTG